MTTPIPDTGISSRELDYWIAEHICGWEWWRSSSTGRRSLFKPGEIPRFDWEWFHERADGAEPLVADWDSAEKRIPAYSTDRSAAFELAWTFPRIDIVRNHKEVFVLLGTAPIKTDTGFRQDEMQGADGHLDDTALIICRAAVAATMKQEEE